LLEGGKRLGQVQAQRRVEGVAVLGPIHGQDEEPAARLRSQDVGHDTLHGDAWGK
jgi:hypothetical protein